MSTSQANNAHKRILIAAPEFHEWDLGSYVRSILKSMNIECDTFSYQPFKSHAEARRGLLAHVEEGRPDVLIGLKLERMDGKTIRAVRNMGVCVALWYVDCVNGKVPGWIRPLVREASIFFTTAKGMLSKYRRVAGTPVFWLYEGAHLPAFPRLDANGFPGGIYRSDVAFVGSIYYFDDHGGVVTDREKFLKVINRNYELRIWGPQGVRDAHERWGEGYSAIEWPAYNSELVKICMSAKIILGINTVNDVELYFSNRTFITLASGGFHLTRYVPGLETMFENERHLVWYHSDEECLGLIEYYLKRPRLREKIASEGRQWTRRRYGMRRQVGRMLGMIERYAG